jgi:UDP-glucuronate decarboxylase
VTQPLLVEVDQIYHLACPASPVFYQNNGIKTIKTNVLGTMNMLGLAKRVHARFLLSSTSEVYGDPDEHPQREEYWGHVNPIGIRSCYDEGKRVAESLAFEYHRQNNVDIRVARIFNTYGPRMLENDGRVVSNFIVQALKGACRVSFVSCVSCRVVLCACRVVSCHVVSCRVADEFDWSPTTGEPLTVYGEGDQTRSFCYVSDLVTGLISLMNGNYIGTHTCCACVVCVCVACRVSCVRVRVCAGK